MKVLRVIKFLIVSLYVVCGIILVVFLLPHTGWRAYRVATGSMTPAIPQGSLVIDHSLPPRNYNVGDVVTYINPYNSRQTITHRVVQKSSLHDLPAYVTKGDANQSPDRRILGGNIVGKVAWHVPYLGNWLAKLKNPLVFVIIIIIPAIFIIVDELRLLFRRLNALQTRPPSSSPPTNHAPQQPNHQPAKPPARRRPSGVDTITKSTILLLVAVAFVGLAGVTRAQLTSQASLTNNRITTASSNGSNPCLSPNDTGSISNTGPGSNNQIFFGNDCSISITNNNSITISNNNHQTTSSGSAAGGSAHSGNATASNSSANTVTINQ